MKESMTVKKAALISAVGKYSTIVLQLIVNAILARLLSPEDYGIIAIITIFSTFFSTISDMGFSTAIVQNKNLKREDINRIFSCSIILGICFQILFCCFSVIISKIYNNSLYIPLGLLLSFSLVSNVANMVPNGIMNKEKRFVSIAVRTVISFMVGAICGILAAFAGAKSFSVVLQSVISSWMIFCWNYIETRPKIQFKNIWESISKIYNYSLYQFLFNVVNYFSRNLDNLLTGRVMGDIALGFYYKAYNLMLYPVNNLSGVIVPVLHPILSDYQNDTETIFQKYKTVTRFMVIIGAFITPVCFFSAEGIIDILYGNKWGATIPCFQVLSLAILPQMAGSTASAIYQSLGKTNLLFYNGIVNTGITVIATLVGVFIGESIVNLSISITVSYILHFFVIQFILFRYGFKKRVFSGFKVFYKEILIAIFMFLFIFTLDSITMNPVVTLIMNVAIGGIVYLVMIKIFGLNSMIRSKLFR